MADRWQLGAGANALHAVTAGSILVAFLTTRGQELCLSFELAFTDFLAVVLFKALGEANYGSAGTIALVAAIVFASPMSLLAFKVRRGSVIALYVALILYGLDSALMLFLAGFNLLLVLRVAVFGAVISAIGPAKLARTKLGG